MRETSLSRFTPSLLSKESLEALLVQRQPLARSIVEGVSESVLTANKHYYLIIGPRGIGKTHMISLIFHRVNDDASLKDRLLTAWLREEEWGVASYFHFLLAILRALAERYNGDLTKQLDELRSLADIEKAEPVAEEMLKSFVGNKTLLLLVENFDEIFEGLGEEGQHKLRAFIQNNPFFTIVAAAQSLFNGVTLRSEPFYGFFETHHLSELSFATATELVANIAKQEGKADLVKSLHSPQGRARMRAVHHLAGGNPRVYVIFSQFVTAKSIQSLVEPLLQTLDDLTPYYQSRMMLLSPQQRQIVDYLCEVRGAKSVKEITHGCFISSQQTTSSQMKKLSDLGYVRVTKNKRESYYELREPLLRLTLDVKKSRGEPVGIIVDFLRIWYSSDELSSRLSRVGEQAAVEKHYLEAALDNGSRGTAIDLVALCETAYEQNCEAGDWVGAQQASEELRAIRGSAHDLFRAAETYAMQSRYAEAIVLLTEYLQMPDIPAKMRAVALLVRGGSHSWCDDHNAAIADYTAAAGIPDAPPGNDALAILWRGLSYTFIGEYDAAIAGYTSLIDGQKLTAELRAKAILGRGISRGHSGDDAAAIADFTTLINIADAPEHLRVQSFFNRAISLGRIGNDLRAIDDYTTFIEMVGSSNEQFGSALLARGIRYTAIGDDIAANADLMAVMEMSDIPEELRQHAENGYGVQLLESGRISEAHEVFSRTTAESFEFVEAHENLGEVLACLGRVDDAIDSLERAIELRGDDFSFNLMSNYAAVLILAGRLVEGRVKLREAIGRQSGDNANGDGSKFAIVRNLLLRSKDPAEWRRIIPEFIKPCVEFDAMPLLGEGVVASIGTLRRANISPEVATKWLAVWREMAGDYKQMALPLRLLDAGVHYLRDQDQRALLTLPIEERKIIEPLLGIIKKNDE